MKRDVAFLFLLALLGCNKHPCPKLPYSKVEVPPPPDYASLDFWAAHPQKKDFADSVPGRDLKNNQDSAKADVFFIHPTTYKSKEAWNANLSDDKLNEDTDSRPILHQASIFNGSCRVYAPRYRQMNLNAFFGGDSASKKQALALAYSDVRAAFKYYLEHENKGRPIVIASHSQGTVHAIHIVKEFFDGQKLQEQLVAAYLVGWAIQEGTFSSIPVCNSPDKTECFATWSTFEWGFPPEHEEWFANAVVVNPVTWCTCPDSSTFKDHKGTVLRAYDSPTPNFVCAKANHGYLWVTKPDIPGKFLLRTHNYHVADYNIFWMDVRENVNLRVNEWIKTHPANIAGQ